MNCARAFLNDLIDGVSVPILLVQGGEEKTYFDDLDVMYDTVTGPKALLTINGTNHYDVFLNKVFVQYSRTFLDVYLDGDEDSRDYLVGDSAQQDIDDGLIELDYQLESVEDPVEEDTSQPITEVEDEPSGGIPGYPLWSIALSLILITVILSNNKRLTSYSPYC